MTTFSPEELQFMATSPTVLNALAAYHSLQDTEERNALGDYDHYDRCVDLTSAAKLHASTTVELNPKLRPNGSINYRNVGLAFAASVLHEMGKEVPEGSDIHTQMTKAFKAVARVMVMGNIAVEPEEIVRCQDIWTRMHTTMMELPEYKELYKSVTDKG